MNRSSSSAGSFYQGSTSRSSTLGDSDCESLNDFVNESIILDLLRASQDRDHMVKTLRAMSLEQIDKLFDKFTEEELLMLTEPKNSTEVYQEATLMTPDEKACWSTIGLYRDRKMYRHVCRYDLLDAIPYGIMRDIDAFGAFSSQICWKEAIGIYVTPQVQHISKCLHIKLEVALADWLHRNGAGVDSPAQGVDMKHIPNFLFASCGPLSKVEIYLMFPNMANEFLKSKPCIEAVRFFYDEILLPVINQLSLNKENAFKNNTRTQEFLGRSAKGTMMRVSKIVPGHELESLVETMRDLVDRHVNEQRNHFKKFQNFLFLTTAKGTKEMINTSISDAPLMEIMKKVFSGWAPELAACKNDVFLDVGCTVYQKEDTNTGIKNRAEMMCPDATPKTFMWSKEGIDRCFRQAGFRGHKWDTVFGLQEVMNAHYIPHAAFARRNGIYYMVFYTNDKQLLYSTQKNKEYHNVGIRDFTWNDIYAPTTRYKNISNCMNETWSIAQFSNHSARFEIRVSAARYDLLPDAEWHSWFEHIATSAIAVVDSKEYFGIRLNLLQGLEYFLRKMKSKLGPTPSPIYNDLRNVLVAYVKELSARPHFRQKNIRRKFRMPRMAIALGRLALFPSKQIESILVHKINNDVPLQNELANLVIGPRQQRDRPELTIDRTLIPEQIIEEPIQPAFTVDLNIFDMSMIANIAKQLIDQLFQDMYSRAGDAYWRMEGRKLRRGRLTTDLVNSYFKDPQITRQASISWGRRWRAYFQLSTENPWGSTTPDCVSNRIAVENAIHRIFPGDNEEMELACTRFLRALWIEFCGIECLPHMQLSNSRKALYVKRAGKLKFLCRPNLDFSVTPLPDGPSWDVYRLFDERIRRE